MRHKLFCVAFRWSCCCVSNQFQTSQTVSLQCHRIAGFGNWHNFITIYIHTYVLASITSTNLKFNVYSSYVGIWDVCSAFCLQTQHYMRVLLKPNQTTLIRLLFFCYYYKFIQWNYKNKCINEIKQNEKVNIQITRLVSATFNKQIY